jgi:hypothetical protein
MTIEVPYDMYPLVHYLRVQDVPRWFPPVTRFPYWVEDKRASLGFAFCFL